jgi:hypothetical protein
MFGQVDDSIVKPEFVDCEVFGVWTWCLDLLIWDLGLSRYCKENFESWGKESVGEGLMRTWSGKWRFVVHLYSIPTLCSHGTHTTLLFPNYLSTYVVQSISQLHS